MCFLRYPNGPESSDPWPQYRRPGDAVLSVGINTTVKYNFLLDRWVPTHEGSVRYNFLLDRWVPTHEGSVKYNFLIERWVPTHEGSVRYNFERWLPTKFIQ
jgi:hypothetical protein